MGKCSFYCQISGLCFKRCCNLIFVLKNLDLGLFVCTSRLDTCFSSWTCAPAVVSLGHFMAAFECYRLQQHHLTQLHLLATLAGSGAPKSAPSSLEADCWVHYVLKNGEYGGKMSPVSCVEILQEHKNSPQHSHVRLSEKKV